MSRLDYSAKVWHRMIEILKRLKLRGEMGSGPMSFILGFPCFQQLDEMKRIGLIEHSADRDCFGREVDIYRITDKGLRVVLQDNTFRIFSFTNAKRRLSE